jgi:predicted Rossmann fold flavoprotein
VTHKGISGPAVLRLSAVGARKLAESQWQADLSIDWTGSLHSREVVYGMLQAAAKSKAYGKRMVRAAPPAELGAFFPKRLWARICLLGAVPLEDLSWANLSKAAMRRLAADITSFPFSAGGKSTNKEEFVTAGGVALENLRMPSMESRRFPGLYSIGEMNDVDGVTGGYNFTSCWSQAWHAGNHISGALAREGQAGAGEAAG